jgi:hypothetical protein
LKRSRKADSAPHAAQALALRIVRGAEGLLAGRKAQE